MDEFLNYYPEQRDDAKSKEDEVVRAMLETNDPLFKEAFLKSVAGYIDVAKQIQRGDDPVSKVFPPQENLMQGNDDQMDEIHKENFDRLVALQEKISKIII